MRPPTATMGRLFALPLAAVVTLAAAQPGCTAAPEQPAPPPVTDRARAFEPFARASGVEAARRLAQLPSVANAAQPVYVVRHPLTNASALSDADAAHLTRVMHEALAAAADRSRIIPVDPAPPEPTEHTRKAAPQAPLPPPGTPPQRLIDLEGSLATLDRPGSRDDIHFFELVASNAATRVRLATITTDSRQWPSPDPTTP